MAWLPSLNTFVIAHGVEEENIYSAKSSWRPSRWLDDGGEESYAPGSRMEELNLVRNTVWDCIILVLFALLTLFTWCVSSSLKLKSNWKTSLLHFHKVIVHSRVLAGKQTGSTSAHSSPWCYPSRLFGFERCRSRCAKCFACWCGITFCIY